MKVKWLMCVDSFDSQQYNISQDRKYTWGRYSAPAPNQVSSTPAGELMNEPWKPGIIQVIGSNRAWPGEELQGESEADTQFRSKAKSQDGRTRLRCAAREDRPRRKKTKTKIKVRWTPVYGRLAGSMGQGLRGRMRRRKSVNVAGRP